MRTSSLQEDSFPSKAPVLGKVLVRNMTEGLLKFDSILDVH